jgi:hypothetical protein
MKYPGALFRSALSIAVAASVGWNVAAPADTLPLLIEIEDLRNLPLDSEGHPQRLGTAPTGLLLFFHDGSFDTYDMGSPADDALRGWIEGEGAGALVEKLHAADPDAFVDTTSAPTAWGAEYAGDNLELRNQLGDDDPEPDPARHRYLSFLNRIHPSDDAFVGNDDPMRYEIFDANGRFTGPLVIDVYGADVLDAGTRRNDETGLVFLDLPVPQSPEEPSQSSGTPTSEPVGRHPGFNGSWRNPDGAPKRILGADFILEHAPGGAGSPVEQLTYHYDPHYADFSRPGAKLFRIRISQGASESFTGVYADPARAGEGVTLHMFRNAENQSALGFTWYTYAPDGSGDPVFLLGAAGAHYWDEIVLDLYQSRGGRFGGPQNPDDVQTTLWGQGTLRFLDPECNTVQLAEIAPLDPAWTIAPSIPNGILEWTRITPLPKNAKAACARRVAPPLPM